MSPDGNDQAETAPVGSSTVMLRALVREVEVTASGSCAQVRSLLEQDTPESDRAALRLLAVWLISNPEAAAALRSRLRGH